LWLALSVLVGRFHFPGILVLAAAAQALRRPAGSCGMRDRDLSPSRCSARSSFTIGWFRSLMIDEWLAVRTDHPPMLKSAYNA
jgi:hypothetical protein